MLLAALCATALASEPRAVSVRLTALDLPYNAWGGAYRPLSMQTSLDLGFAGTRLGTHGVREGFRLLRSDGLEYGLGLPALAVVNLFAFAFVGGWVHEEWHRAVMASHDISSRNTIYDPRVWDGSVIAVDQVTDEDLARLKQTSPSDTARLMTAGMESQLELARRLGDAAFFEEGGRTRGGLYLSDSWLSMTMLFQEISAMGYLGACAEGLDELTDEMNREELTVPERDFAGADCTAWVYGLHRPSEPYESRGPHPYGAGIDRYRSGEDLTEQERAFLHQQFQLSLLNLIDPHLLSIDGFVLSNGTRWVASVGHTPNPFGHTLSLRGALQPQAGPGLLVVAQAHGWQGSITPGLEVTLHDQHLSALRLTSGLGLWLQPEALRADATRSRPGGRLHAQLGWMASERLELFVGAEAKSAGWVPGNVFLGPNASVRSGIVAHLP
jgi:hypothetical protein